MKACEKKSKLVERFCCARQHQDIRHEQSTYPYFTFIFTNFHLQGAAAFGSNGVWLTSIKGGHWHVVPMEPEAAPLLAVI
jgi:hypothetical protein